jgi:hypothetical protein
MWWAAKGAIFGRQPHRLELAALFGEIIAVHDDGGGVRSIVIPASTDLATSGRRLRSAESTSTCPELGHRLRSR